MKYKSSTKIVLLAFCAFFMVVFNSCDKEDVALPQSDANAQRVNDYNRVFPPNAVVLGKTREEWMADYYRWVFQFDCANLPYLDSTGALQNLNQPNGVFFLNGKRTTVPLHITVPAGQRIFLGQPNIYAPYPNTLFGTPGPNQTLDEFLKIQMDGFLSNYTDNYAILDGDTLNLDGYRTWTGSFQVNLNPDLVNCVFPQTPQYLFAGGDFVMLKPLSPGQHTIKRGGIYYGYYLEWNYIINQL